MTEDERHVELLARLDTLIRLQAHSLVSGGDSQGEKIFKLHRAGLTTKVIAEIVGTTANTVSVTISKANSKAKAKKAGGADDGG